MFEFRFDPVALPENQICGPHYRITLITDRLVRFEYSETDTFEDRASQRIWYRNLGKVSYEKQTTKNGIRIRTDRMIIDYDEKPFSKAGLSVLLIAPPDSCQEPWYFGKKTKNLGGTARTLDTIDGACPLEDGILGADGFAVLEDSESVLLENDWIYERTEGNQDLYLFAYGISYKEALDAFYQITGKTPMLPRYALGNWWSRYYKYTEESYLKLMDRFDQEEIPLSVAVIDMDWHITDVDKKIGGGWTGYTWNREFFPDPKRFLDTLHNRGMSVTLNVHPASGIRSHEECYERVAARMGVDPESKRAVPFDFTDPAFIDTYFEEVHTPLEKEGVDFWWIDWQQGTHTSIKGMDPLWMLNHYHFRDSAKNGKRPMTFSRYAGPGSHRYPVGFSGDTVITWESLDFQQYFTYTASNIGYGWWSHDIGGHMYGYRDDVLEARWYQLGVFSPLNRLHSSNLKYAMKEPWMYRAEVRESMDQILKLRHRMIPYLYTMNHRAWKENLPLITPMYYEYPEDPSAYPFTTGWNTGCKNQFFFGTEMITCPITSPQIPVLDMGKTTAWLPEGIYHDFFTGLTYRGGRNLTMYRDLNSIPVLVKAGGIIPLTNEIYKEEFLKNPNTLEVHVYAGADGSFTLYEDDNTTNAYMDGICATTDLSFDWEKGIFSIGEVKGDVTLIPDKRSYTVYFHGIEENSVKICCADETKTVKSEYDPEKRCLCVVIPEVSAKETTMVCLEQAPVLARNEIMPYVEDILNRAQIPYVQKERSDLFITENSSLPARALSMLHAIGLDEDVLMALEEILTADL